VTAPVLIDAGPLVAALNARERHHAWVREQLAALRPPLLTCEAVLSEACFLLSKIPGGAEAVLGLVRRGAVTVAFSLAAEVEAVERLLARYRSVPISLANACLVRLAEKTPEAVVLTFDRDFTIYRIHGRRAIPTRMPP
jgi:predicted nucleic acid-binding protein